MMIALDTKRRLVNAQYAEKSQTYYCPACRSSVVFKKGEQRLPHFAHRPHDTCSVFSEGETEEHLYGKSLLYEWLKASHPRVALESYLPELQQRPDVLFTDENGQLVCIEFQCSHLDQERMLARHQGYLEKGYKVYWIVGKKFHIHRRNLSRFQQLFLTLNETNNMIFLQLDVLKGALTVAYDFRTKGLHNITHDRRHFYLKNHSWQDIQTEMSDLAKVKNIPATQDYQAIHKAYMKKLYYRDKRLQPVLQEMYHNRDHLQMTTHHLYHSVDSEWLIKTEPLEWKYSFIQSLNKSPRHRKMTLTVILDGFSDSALVYIDNPNLTEELKRKPLIEYFNYLVDCGYMKRVGAESFYIKKRIEHFKTIHEKMCFLRRSSLSHK